MENQKHRHWKKEEHIINKILSHGIGQYAKTIDIQHAFSLKDRSLRCMDEGTPGGIRLAGSGILLGEQETLEFCRKSKVDGVYSHEECGAVGIYLKENNIDKSRMDIEAIRWAKDIAGKAAIPYKGHIRIDEMARPSHLHTARAAYYDGTGSFDCSQSKDLPQGFVISRRYLNKDYARKELETSISIALSDHGFGELFTKDAPFIIIPIGDSENAEFSLETLKSELEALKSEIPNMMKRYEGKVVVDGFYAPK